MIRSLLAYLQSGLDHPEHKVDLKSVYYDFAALVQGRESNTAAYLALSV
jgi:hypothetical protein